LPLPADQWHLLATVAPRLLLVGSADDDLPADPEGERLSTIAASNIWRLHGQLEPWEPGPARTGYPIGHHRRPGGHDLLREDWEHYLRDVGAFLDR
jgi:hypothetical protein